MILSTWKINENSLQLNLKFYLIHIETYYENFTNPQIFSFLLYHSQHLRFVKLYAQINETINFFYI